MPKEIVRDIAIFDKEVSAVFKPVAVDIPKLVEECKGLTISGVDDIEGYAVVFASLQKLKKARTDITKFAKSLRDEYTHKNRKIREIEDGYVSLIEPVENELKAQREAIDGAKKIAERMILLPSRQKMLGDIGIVMTNEEILSFDETSFATMYTSSKQVFDEEQEREKERVAEQARIEKEQEAEKIRIEEEKQSAVAQAKIDAEREAIFQAKEVAAKVKRDNQAAAEQARIDKEEAAKKAEKDKQDALDKLKQEQVDAENARLADLEKAAKDARFLAEQQKRDEEEQLKRTEKNKQYRDWVVGLGIFIESGDKVEHVGDTFIAYKKVGEIVIK